MGFGFLQICVKWIVMSAVFYFCVSCSSLNHEVGKRLNLDTDLKLEILSETDINPDEEKKSSPVFIRLYELSSTSAFEKADFIDLYERDVEVLGDTFIAKQELKRMVPNTFREETFVLSSETRFVGLFAEFFNYEDAQAKVFFPVTEANVVRNNVGVKISGNRIQLVNIKHRSPNNRKSNSSTYSVEKEK